MALYDELGGAEAIGAALDHFYPRILADPVLSPFFHGVDMARLKQHAISFITMATGGRAAYRGPGLRQVHSRLLASGLDDAVFDRFVSCFDGVLVDLGVGETQRAQVHALLEGARADVLSR